MRPQGVESVEIQAEEAPYALEAKAFSNAVFGDAAPWISKQETLGNMRILDELRISVEFLFPSNLEKSHHLKDLHAVDKSTLFVNVKNWIIFISLGVILTSCKPLKKAASVGHSIMQVQLERVSYLRLSVPTPLPCIRQQRKPTPSIHQDQMLIDLHNQLLAVRTRC